MNYQHSETGQIITGRRYAELKDEDKQKFGKVKANVKQTGGGKTQAATEGTTGQTGGQ